MRNSLETVTVLLLISILGFSSCSLPSKKNENGYVIRYCDIQAVYRYVLSENPSAVKLKIKKEKLTREREGIIKILKQNPSELQRQKLPFINKELGEISKKEKDLKAKIIKSINHVLKKVAKDTGADFILNYGEGLLYGDGHYDVTEDVIRYYTKMQKRSAPVSR